MAEKTKLALVDENYEGPDQNKLARASLIKEGRQRERKDLAPKVRAADGFAQLQEAHAEKLKHTELQLLRERDTHGKHKRAVGRFEGMVAGLAIGTLLAYVLMPVVTTAVSGLLHEATVTGAMVSSQQEREPRYARPDRGEAIPPQ